MTFSEALEAMKQGYKVRRKEWYEKLNNLNDYIISKDEYFVNSNNNILATIKSDSILATDWEIYNEPKPEPQFEIGEIVMMRNSDTDMWKPKHFAFAKEGKSNGYNYLSISGSWYVQCAKFDKDIVFTNKPAKL